MSNKLRMVPDSFWHISFTQGSYVCLEMSHHFARSQAFTWAMLLIGTLRKNFSEILIEIQTLRFNEMQFKTLQHVGHFSILDV